MSKIAFVHGRSQRRTSNRSPTEPDTGQHDRPSASSTYGSDVPHRASPIDNPPCHGTPRSATPPDAPIGFDTATSPAANMRSGRPTRRAPVGAQVRPTPGEAPMAGGGRPRVSDVVP